MSAISDARVAMASLLAGELADVQTFAFMPSRFSPNAVIILPDAPYLSAGSTFGTFTLGLSVVVVADAKVNESGANTLDQLVDDATVALVNAGIAVSEVSEPWQMSAGNAAYLASTITTTQPVSL